ncbi:MAG: U32 family peptidase, partial [Phascolarctobacterium sp.]|nr:U32 family peptidase [Candidatus Phascolarctobacterium caballi]
MRKTVKPELLAPAGNLEKGKIALIYGADAIYLGGKQFGLRAMADNFSFDEMKEMVKFAHDLGKKVYVTVNIFAHNTDIDELPDYLRAVAKTGVDALLISDLGVWNVAKQVVPQLPLHVSTQANTTNYASVLAWEKLGAQRVVLARELSLQEIAEIGSKTSVELECFVHGAMCISYSGRCLLSAYLTGRDGNRGACTQACRWKYSLVEETRPAEKFSMQENEHGTFIMNSKDLCLIEYLPDLVKAGVSSFKIEGRMRSAHYVATIVSVYRKAIDACFADIDNYAVPQDWLTELEKVSHRPYSTGFAVHKPDAGSQVYATSTYEQTHDFVAWVLDYNAETKRVYLEQRNHLTEGEELEILMPNGNIISLILQDMQDADGVSIS